MSERDLPFLVAYQMKLSAKQQRVFVSSWNNFVVRKLYRPTLGSSSPFNSSGHLFERLDQHSQTVITES